MRDLIILEKAIEELNKNYPRPGIPPLNLSAPYDIEKDFHKSFYNSGFPGVYFFLDKEGSLLYVGKASHGSNLGARLATYFRWDKDRTKGVPHLPYYEKIRFIVNIPLPIEHAFEAPAIEEFFIKKLETTLNVVGRKKCRPSPILNKPLISKHHSSIDGSLT